MRKWAFAFLAVAALLSISVGYEAQQKVFPETGRVVSAYNDCGCSQT